jgi:hypothetical protein
MTLSLCKSLVRSVSTWLSRFTLHILYFQIHHHSTYPAFRTGFCSSVGDCDRFGRSLPHGLIFAVRGSIAHMYFNIFCGGGGGSEWWMMFMGLDGTRRYDKDRWMISDDEKR